MSAEILIIDDDFDIRDSLVDILRDDGYTVATAEDGHQGLDYLRNNPIPKLVLVDWMMPRCNGAQFVDELARDAALATIPVVVLTADSRVAQTATRECLTKPVKLERLLELVARYCAR